MTIDPPPTDPRYRNLKKAWKLPRAIRRPLLWVAGLGGLLLVLAELVHAWRLWIGGGA